MSRTFTPSDAIDMTKEKDWPLNLGMMDWDSVNIVFTKRSLIEFLKYSGVTVDTNFSNIQKLPRYAKFGNLSSEENATAAAPVATAAAPVDPNIPKPSRRVRDVPGGSHTDIFGNEFTEAEDALTHASPRPVPTAATLSSPPIQETETQEDQGIAFSSAPKPSRRVRAPPGGNSSIGASFWGTDEAEAPEFKPTRRVTQETGGKDSISSIF